MEEILKQSVTYANITVFKNYSPWSPSTPLIEPEIEKVPEEEIQSQVDRLTISIDPEIEIDRKLNDFLFKQIKGSWKATPRKRWEHSIRLFIKSNRKTNFFYSTSPTETFQNNRAPGCPNVFYERVDIVNAKSLLKNSKETDPSYFQTTSERHIRSHYNNPFSSIEIYKIERWIKRDGDKITLKTYANNRSRKLNSIYFTKSTHSTTLVFNMRTGNFTVVTYNAGGKRKEKRFFCNSFTSLRDGLSSIYNITNRVPLDPNFRKEFNIAQWQKEVKLALGFNDRFSSWKDDITINDLSDKKDTNMFCDIFIAEWTKKFTEIKKIKTSDNSEKLLRSYYPTEKYLKKNNRKLVASILDRFGIKSNLTIKILHEYPYTDIGSLVEICRIFGSEYTKYLGNVQRNFFTRSLQTEDNIPFLSKHILTSPNRQLWNNLHPSEKENIVHILNDFSNKEIVEVSNVVVMSFTDHFRMLSKLRPYYPNFKLNARKWETYLEEHSELARFEREIVKGYTTELVFEDAVIAEIEKTIETTEITQPPVMFLDNVHDRIKYEQMYCNMSPMTAVRKVFHPYLLKNSQDYFNEGTYMNHCVAGYINTDHSIIVSLRNGKDRVTCQYDTKTRKCVQAKYFGNKRPPEYYDEALKLLDKQIKSIPLPIKPLDRRDVPLVINGIQVRAQSNTCIFNPVEEIPAYGF